ncbi:porin [Roseovarius faecimaris]|uniref:Porin n=1 Tax=Roseovarius faecimaris TaxID=2494550 RepID=A0A6I6ISD2_9RHOB|nr:porin [Roseovarius faecimaris]QGX98803.1 porin [Roseovarius faecimaris]
MKKQLLCTSAIALGVAAAAPASAQDWNLDWGGFMSQHVAFIDGDLKVGGATAPGFDWSGLELHQTAEIIFTPSITLDNGLTFGVNIQFEGQNGLNIDESYMSISSDTFGRLDIGAENSAGYKSMVGAPTVTSMWINSPSISTFIALSASGALPFAFRQAAISSYTEVAGNNDVRRISYYTPSFNGLTIGVSYARDGVTNAGNNYGLGLDTNGIFLSDVMDIGVNYSQSFGNADVNIGARYGTGSYAAGNPASDPETWGIGATVGFGGFTIGGSYAENDNGAANGVGDQEGWSFGMTYDAAGPWAFEALTYQGETTVAPGVTSDYTAYKVGASRDLGPGVDWDVYAVMAENGVSGTLEVEGFAVGTAINLSF